MVVPIVLFISLLVYGSFFVCSQFYSRAICQGDKTKKQIALTFDDGPVPGKTDRVLDVLAHHSVKGTFFCIGKRLAENKKYGQRIHDEGHLMGNHSYKHGFLFDMLPASKMENELQQTDEVIASINGEQPQWFRPPYGVTNPPLARAVQRTGHKLAGWNIRTLDTVKDDPQLIADKVKRQLQPGAVILLHDSMSVVPEVLEELIPYLKETGYNFVRFDELV